MDRRLILLVVVLSIASILGIGLVLKTPPKLAIASVMAILLFFVCFTNTEITLYILIFSMLLSPEFGARGTSGGGMTIRTDDLLLLLIGFTWFARTAVYKELGFFLRTSLNKPILYYIVSCAFPTLIGMIVGRVDITGVFFVLKYIEYFIVYFMAANYIQSMRQVRGFTVALLVTCVIVSLMAIAQIPAGERISAPFEGKGGEPNTLGGYLDLMLSIVLAFLLVARPSDSRILRATLIGMAGLFTIPLLFSQSRGSWAGALVMYVSFMILSKRKSLMAVGLVLGLLAAPFALPKEVKQRFTYTFQEESGYAGRFQEKVGGVTFDTSASARIQSWQGGLKASMKRLDLFLLGYGVTGWKFLDAQFIRVLVEAGAIGLAAFLMMIRAVMRDIWQVYRESEDTFSRGLSLGLFVGTIALLTHSIFANTFIIVRIMEPFWFLTAMVLALPRLRQEEPDTAFFPVGIWMQNPERARTYQAAGINTYVGLRKGPTEGQLDMLRDIGMRVVCRQNDVGLKYRNDPLIVAWMHEGQPDSAQPVPGRKDRWRPAVPPPKIVQDYQEIVRRDATRPVWINFGPGVADGEFEGRTAAYEDYPEYCKGANIVSSSVYPVADLGRPDGENYLWYVARGVDRLREWTHDEKPVWTVIECTRIRNPDKKATPEQVRAEVWMALIHGAQGIVYFAHEWEPRFVEAAILRDPEMLNAVTRINQEIGRLTPVLTGPTTDESAEVRSAVEDVPIDIMTKRHDGAIYLFAVSMRPGDTQGAFKIRTLKGRVKAEVIGENRIVEVVDGGFEDSFGTYEVHLYRIPTLSRAPVEGRRDA